MAGDLVFIIGDNNIMPELAQVFDEFQVPGMDPVSLQVRGAAEIADQGDIEGIFPGADVDPAFYINNPGILCFRSSMIVFVFFIFSSFPSLSLKRNITICLIMFCGVRDE